MTPMESLKAELAACTRCPLGQTRTQTVFGEGPADARVVLVGEAPGAAEDAQGRPFVGRSGQLLDLLLSTVDLARDRNCFITNMVKCRPPENRDPTPDEQARCADFLSKQLALMNPVFVVCVGRIAAQALISPDFRVTREHGQFTEKNGRLMMGTFHPAALLRNPNQKPDAFGDFLRLRARIKELCPEVYAL